MADKTRENKRMAIAAICMILIALLLVMILASSGFGQRKLNGLLDLGRKYLEEMNYEDAVLVFDEAIAIDPKCAQAYLGKAKAQYALGQIDEAVTTLCEGIEQVGDDDSTMLEEFLQQILDELSAVTAQEGEIIEAEETVVETEERNEGALLLNYTTIVRDVSTKDPEIQLEVLGGDTSENYTWESSNPDCAVVSESGLVTCLSTEGEATIQVMDENNRSDSCYVC